MKKIIIVDADASVECVYDGECADPTVTLTIKEYNGIWELLEAELKNDPIMNKKMLKNMGIVFVEDLEKKEKAIATKQFFLTTTRPMGYNGSVFTQVDPETADAGIGKMLASGDVHIVQKISNECLSKDAYDAYLKEKKKIGDIKKRNEAAKKTREENKKLKEIKKAKETLEKAGFTNGN